MKLIIFIYLAALAVLSVSASQCAVYPLFAHGEKFGDNVIEDGDEENVLFELNQFFRFNGESYDAVRIYVKGFISFGKGTDDFSNALLTADEPLISIFYSDVNLNIDDIGKVLYRKVDLEEERQLVETIQRSTADYEQPINPELVFIVTWKDVSCEEFPDKRNTFQLTLASEGEKTIAIFNFGLMSWNDGWRNKVQVADGKGFRDNSHSPKWFGYPNIFTYKPSGLPGRALQRVDEEMFELGEIRSAECTSCSIDLKKGEIQTFDDNEKLNVDIPNRKYLMSKGYRDEANTWRDPCKYMWKVITDKNGHIKSTSFSVGVHPTNAKKYKRNFVFERNTVGSVEGRGHNLKPVPLSLPYTETIWTDVETNVTVNVDVEKSPFGWKVSSRVCQYMFIYNPQDTFNQIRLTLTYEYAGLTLGLCQNNNKVSEDERLTCSMPPSFDEPSEIIETCSCPRRDKTCLKALNMFEGLDK